MGYYTRFTLLQPFIYSIKIDAPWGSHNLHELFKRGELSERKWYEYHDEMKQLSAEYPDTVFKLQGLGEGHGDPHADWWVRTYHRGKATNVQFFELTNNRENHITYLHSDEDI